MKEVLKKASCILLIMVVAFVSTFGDIRLPGYAGQPDIARAAEGDVASGKYVSSIAVSYASNIENAKKDLGDEYTVIDTDFGKSSSTHAWIGFTTTDDPNMAIRDIQVMDMFGDFNYSDYKNLLKEQEKVVNDQMDTVIPAIKEYAKNYDADTAAAVTMHNALNYYFEDDSEKGMGDYLLDAGRALNQSSSDNAVLDDLKKVFLQGSDVNIQAIENILIQAQGNKLNKDGSWMARMSAMGPEGLEAQYKAAYPGASKSELQKKMKEDLNNDASMILGELEIIRDAIKEYEGTDLAKAIESNDSDAIDKCLDKGSTEGTEKEINESMSEDETVDTLVQSMESVNETTEDMDNMMIALLTIYMKGLTYGTEKSVYDFFMREDLKEKDLYPMASLLSSGQKSLIQDVGLYGLFSGVIAGDSELTEESKSNTVSDDISISVYDGVDRDVFNGETAITGPSMVRFSTVDDGPNFFSTPEFGIGLFLSSCVFAVSFGMALLNNPGLDTDTVLGEARYNTTKDKLTAAGRNYESEMKMKIKNVQLDFRKTSLAEIQKRVPRLNLQNVLESPTVKEYNKVLNSLTLEEKLAVRAKITKLEAKVESAEAGMQKKIDARWNKIHAKEATLERGSFMGRYGARIVSVVAGVVAVALVAYAIYDLCNDKGERTEYNEVDIPSYIIDRTYPTGSKEITFVTYAAALDKNGKKADLHKWKGDGWLNVYTTTDPEAGDPIFAEDFGVKESVTDPDLIGVTRFSDKYAYDMTGDKGYLYFRRNEKTAAAPEPGEVAEDENEPEDETEPETASVFGGSTLLIAGLAMIIGVIIGIVSMRVRMK